MAVFEENARQEIRSEANRAREAAVELTRQMAVLWESRLNMAMAAGDMDGVQRMIREADVQRYMDNCNCTGGGTTSALD